MPAKPIRKPLTTQQLAIAAEQRQDAAYIHITRVMLKQARAKPQTRRGK